MRLIQFNDGSQYAGLCLGTAPSISIEPRIGRIYFNVATVVILGLSKGDRLSFFWDESHPREWYLVKTTSDIQGAYILKFPQGCKTALELIAHKLAVSILDSVGVSNRSCSLILCPVTVDGKGMWRITMPQ